MTERSFDRWGKPLHLLAVGGVFAVGAVACGGGAGNGNSPVDGSMEQDAFATADAQTMGDDATGDDQAAPMEASITPVSMPDASDAAIDDATTDGATSAEAGTTCTPATFGTDCPILACQTVSGCVQNACQYTTLTVCPTGPATGTFISGGVDVVMNGVTLHSNIGPFRPADGTVCVGTSCLTGGISP